MNKINIKKSWLLIIGAFFMVSVVSCDNLLEEQPYSSVKAEGFYNNAKQFKLALNGVYATLWSGEYADGGLIILNGVPGKALRGYPNKSQYDAFDWSPNASLLSSLWNVSYQGIGRANYIIKNLKEANIDEEAKEHIDGQAKFLRALFYFNLVRLFGGVPIYKKATTDLSNTNKPRSTSEEVYNLIENDLKDAVKELSPFTAADHAAGRATSAAAKALLAKVYIQQQKWQKAASQAKKVIEMDIFSLYNDYRDIFDPANANGKEQIFSVQHGNGGDPTTFLGSHIIYMFGPPPTTLPDGTGIIFFHAHRTVIWRATEKYFNKTPDTYRKWATMRKKMPFYYKAGSSKLIEKTVSLNHPFIIKYNYLNRSTGNLKTGVRFPLIRYSGILLIYAEALNEANESPAPAAYKAINKVRRRARGVGTPHEQPESVYPDLEGLTTEQFRDSVLVELQRELFAEGKRRYQLLRHGKLIKVAHEMGIPADEFKKIYPIPAEQIARNPNLKQNPGY